MSSVLAVDQRDSHSAEDEEGQQQQQHPRMASTTSISPSPANDHHFSPPPMWSLDDFEFGRQIGEGRFGSVYLAREKSSGFKVAVKAVRKDDVIRLDMRHQLEREVRLQKWASRHPHVLRMFACFWDRKFIYLVTEYCDGGDLSNYRVGPPPHQQATTVAEGSSSSNSDNITFVDESTVACWTKQLLEAVAFLHANNLIHRDIKTDNLMLKRGRIKLGDFTWTVGLQPEPPFDRRRTICGTLDYLSPELVSHLPYDSRLDIWSIACVVYELLVGSPPFEKPRPVDTCLSIQRGDFTIPAGSMSAEAEDFLRSMLVVEPSQRPSCKKLLRHPWIEGAPDTPPSKARRRGNTTQQVGLSSAVAVGGGQLLQQSSSSPSDKQGQHPQPHGEHGMHEVSRALELELSGIDPASVSRATDAGAEQ